MNKLKVFSFLVLSSTAFAAGEMDPNIPLLERQVSEVRFEANREEYGAGVATDDANQRAQDWLFTGALLYWHAKVDGTEFAYVNRGTAYTMPINGKIQEVKFGGDWGYKLGAGRHLAWGNWDTELQYTFFRAHGKRRLSMSDGCLSVSDDGVQFGGGVPRVDAIVPMRAAKSVVGVQENDVGKLFGFCTVANSDYRSRWHSFCLNLGQNFIVNNSCLSLYPHVSVRFDILKQKQKIYHTGGTEVEDVLGLGDGVINVRDKTNFNGMGPQVGVYSRWDLGSGFNLLGGISGAYLLGRWKVSHHEDWMLSHLDINEVDLSECQYGASPTIQWQIGLHYDRAIREGNQHVNVGLDFECHHFWKQFQTFHLSFLLDRARKELHDVSMHGLTVRGTWDF